MEMNVSIFVKVSAALLLVSLILAGTIMPATAQMLPFLVSGYASVDGVPTNGVTVSCNGVSATTKSDSSGNPGYYTIMPSVANGSKVTINFEYGGKTTTVTVTANSGNMEAPSANIVTTSQPGNSNTGNSGSSTSTTTTTTTPTPTPTPTPSTVPPSITPTQTPTTPTPTQTPTTTPDAGNNSIIYIVVGLVAGLAIAGTVYIVFLRKP